MTFPSSRLVVSTLFASVFVCALPVGRVSAQPAASTAPAEATAEATSSPAVAAMVAQAWGLDPSEVRVEFSEEPPADVDSLDAREGAAGRWIVTFWSHGGVIRRFARAGHVAEMPTAVRALARGTVVAADDVKPEAQVVWGAPGGEPEDVVGMVAERTIAVGESLRFPAVRPPFLVRGGEEIEATLVHAGVVVTVRGEALGSGRAGDVVLVRLASGVRMEGHAVAPGQVTLITGGS